MAAEKEVEASGPSVLTKLKSFMIWFLAGINIIVAGAGTFFVYKSTVAWNRPEITEEKIERDPASAALFEQLSEQNGGYIYTMDKFTINLTGSPQRSIRLEVNLELLGKEGFEEIIDPDRKAVARDRIIRVLNEKSFSELETIQGKLALKNTIAMEVNSLLNKGIVKDVFFTDFVVQ